MSGALSAVDFFREYVRAFDSRDAAAISSHYHEPCLLVTPPGVFALATEADVRRAFAPFMRDLEARGFARSEYETLTGKLLSDSLALVSGICTRYDGAGAVLQRFGHTCTLRHSKDRWRIVVNAVHEPGAVLAGYTVR